MGTGNARQNQANIIAGDKRRKGGQSTSGIRSLVLKRHAPPRNRQRRIAAAKVIALLFGSALTLWAAEPSP